MRRLRHLLLLLPLALAACATPPPPPPPEPVVAAPAPAPKPTKVVEKGGASYYAKKLNGRRTASGEKHDSQLLVGASKSLPLGSVATVTNTSTGASVLVRINDRGPHTPGRIIDLSQTAAAAIGLDRFNGVANVTVEATPENQPTESLKRAIAAAASRSLDAPEAPAAPKLDLPSLGGPALVITPVLPPAPTAAPAKGKAAAKAKPKAKPKTPAKAPAKSPKKLPAN